MVGEELYYGLLPCGSGRVDQSSKFCAMNIVEEGGPQKQNVDSDAMLKRAALLGCVFRVF